MTKGTLYSRLLALTVLLVGSSAARADLIPWGYDWTATPSFVTGGTGKVTLSNETFHPAVGSSQVVATNLKVFSTADPSTPDTFGVTDGKYSLAIKLIDTNSGMSATLTFTGQLQGTFSASNALITNAFTGLASQSVMLGGNTYTVTMNAYTPPGPPEQGNLGSIGAFVDVRKGIVIERAPEPTSLALGVVGVGLAGLAVWRRRRLG